MGNVSASSCRCCVHPVAVLNAAFCMTCSLLMLVEDAGVTIYVRGIPQNLSHDGVVVSHECLFLFSTCCCGECFYYL